MFKTNKYQLNEGIYDFKINHPVTDVIKKFYEDTPFPNYKEQDNKSTILEIGDKNFLMKHLKEFVGHNKKILEVGAGTCQFSNYLAINSGNEIVSGRSDRICGITGCVPRPQYLATLPSFSATWPGE